MALNILDKLRKIRSCVLGKAWKIYSESRIRREYLAGLSSVALRISSTVLGKFAFLLETNSICFHLRDPSEQSFLLCNAFS